LVEKKKLFLVVGNLVLYSPTWLEWITTRFCVLNFLNIYIFFVPFYNLNPNLNQKIGSF
jgi:hypothetical protein